MREDVLIGMTEPAERQAIMTIKIGQWIKVHWTDSEPSWMLVASKVNKKFNYVDAYDPIIGKTYVTAVPFDQISKIGDMIQLPKN